MIRAALSLLEFLHSVYVPSRLELTAGTIRQMEFSIRVLDRWAGRALEIYDLSEDLLRRFLTDYRRGHSPATTNSKRCQLLALWQCAYDEEYLDRPPRRKRVRRAVEPDPLPEAWTPEEVGRILMAARATTGDICGVPTPAWWESLLLVLYDTGERRGATLAAATDDIDLDQGSILFLRRKGGRRRRCPLHPDTVSACRKILMPARRIFWPWPFSREALDKRFRKILRAADVLHGPGHGGLLHKLRRTSGTLIEQAGGDGAAQIGATRAVFLRHYRDPRFAISQLHLLPRPK